MAAGVTATVEDCTRLLCDRTVTEIGAGRLLYYALQPRYSLWCCPLILWHVLRRCRTLSPLGLPLSLAA
jgi:hypothetical protein